MNVVTRRRKHSGRYMTLSELEEMGWIILVLGGGIMELYS